MLVCHLVPGVDFVSKWYRIYRGRAEPTLFLSRDGALKRLLPLVSSDDRGPLFAQAMYQAWVCASDLSDAFVRVRHLGLTLGVFP
jgi:hypothetical protein